MNSLSRVAIVLACGARLLAGLGVGTSAGTRPEPVTVEVTVTSCDGTPLDGLLVSVYGSPGESVADVTDLHGVVSLQVARPTTESTVIVALTPPDFYSVSSTDYEAQASRRAELVEQFSFAGRYVVALESGQSSYALAIEGMDAVSVRGRLVSQGEPVWGGAARIGALWGTHSDRETGLFSVGGIRLGEPAKVLITQGNGQERIYSFDSTQTNDDVNLGDVELAPVVGDAEVQIDVTDWDDVDRRGRSRSPSICLVRADGAYAITLMVDSQDRARVFRTDEGPVLVPAGEYYIAPAPAGPDPVSTRLIDLVLEGSVNLDAAGVPKVVAVAGQATVVELDVPAAEAAILNAGG